MAVIALIAYLIFALLGFGWRGWRQYQHTGSTGFRGISGGVGSVEWWAGAGFVAAIATSAAAPILQLAGIVSPIGVLDHGWVQGAGVALTVAGIAATVCAQYDMGDSWRIGVDPGESTTLVRDGAFALVRNPIFTAMLTASAGITLMVPNPIAIVAFVLLVVTIELQVRVVEEPYLARTHGQVYRDYTRSVGRFVPGLGRA